MNTTIASLLNLGGPDMMIILLIILLLFGAKKLPELARSMGRAVSEFGAARDQIEKGLIQSSRGGDLLQTDETVATGKVGNATAAPAKRAMNYASDVPRAGSLSEPIVAP